MASPDDCPFNPETDTGITMSRDVSESSLTNPVPSTSPGSLLSLDDNFLASLADDVLTEEDAESLGRALEIKQAAINRFMATNRIDGRVTCKGTREMLFAWRQQVSPLKQPKVLREALLRAGLFQLAQLYCGEKTKPSKNPVPESHLLIFDDFTQTLQNHYNTVLCQIQRRPWDPNDFADFSHLYTDITLFKYDRSTGELRKVPLRDSVNGIFSTRIRGEYLKRILLSAPGGHGKTCAVAKLAYDWANQVEGSPMKDIRALFVLKMRELHEMVGLGAAIISQLIGIIPGVTPEAIENFIHDHQDECALICDGYDEYKGSINTASLLNSLVQVLRNKKLKNCRVLVTTRPFLEGDFSQGELARTYSKMEIEGFTPEYAAKYTMRYFKSRSIPHEGESLLDHLSNNTFLNNLIKVPLFCTMVCHLFEVHALSDTRSMSSLFNNINQFLYEHSVAKESDSFHKGTELKRILQGLGKVAFDGLCKDGRKLIFNESDFREHMDAYVMGLKLGILSTTKIPIKHLQHNQTSRITVEFFHKLEQEYCASAYLQQDEPDNRGSVLKFRSSSPLNAGLRDINTVAKTLELENVLVLVAGASARACLAVFRHIAGQVEDFVLYYKCRMVLHCLVEAEPGFIDPRVTQTLKKCFSNGKMDLHPLTDTIMTGIERLPEAAKSAITFISIYSTHPSATMTARLWSCLASFDHLHDLYLNNTSLPIQEPLALPSIRRLEAWSLAADTFRKVTECLPALNEMVVWIGDDSDAGHTMSEVTRSLGTTGETLKVLEINGLLNTKGSPVSGVNCREFGQMIQRAARRLETLCLEEVKISDESGMIDIVRACQGMSSMKEIRLRRCGSLTNGTLQSFLDDVGTQVESFRRTRNRRLKVIVEHNDDCAFYWKVLRVDSFTS